MAAHRAQADGRLVRPGDLRDRGSMIFGLTPSELAERCTVGPPLASSGGSATPGQTFGLILPGSALPSHGIRAVIATEHQNLDADVGAVRQQLALEYQADFLPAEIPGRVLE